MNKILEKFWLVVASIATLLTVVIGIMDNFEGIRMFMIVCGLAWGIYFIRRGLRIRLEKLDNNKPNKKK